MGIGKNQYGQTYNFRSGTYSWPLSKLATKIGNLELKIDMQYVRRAKLGKIIRKTTQIKNKNGFF